VKVILEVKTRFAIVNEFDAHKEKLLEILGSEELLEQVKKAADISMGVDVSEEDVEQMQELGGCIHDMLN